MHIAFLNVDPIHLQTGKSLSLGLTAPLAILGGVAIKAAMDMETAQVSFEVMLGSAEKARSMLAEMQQFASKTPFEFQGLADSAKTLLQFGISGDQIMPTLKMLGDVAMGDSNKLAGLSIVFGQIQSTGRLMGQDLLQLINQGFNPLQVISKQTGESMASLKVKMEKGAISAEMVTGAFKSATSQGGLFYKGMEKLGQTSAGLLSTMKDDATTLARSFGELLLPAVKDILSGLSGFFQQLNSLDEGTKRTIINMALVAAAIGPIVFGIGKLSGALNILKGHPIILALSLIAEGIILVGGLLDNLSQQSKLAAMSTDATTKAMQEYHKEATSIIGPITNETRQRTLTADQVERLIKLYPELRKQLTAGVTTTEQAAAAELNANIQIATANKLAQEGEAIRLRILQQKNQEAAERKIASGQKLNAYEQNWLKTYEKNAATAEQAAKDADTHLKALRASQAKLIADSYQAANPQGQTPTAETTGGEKKEKDDNLGTDFDTIAKNFIDDQNAMIQSQLDAVDNARAAEEQRVKDAYAAMDERDKIEQVYTARVKEETDNQVGAIKQGNVEKLMSIKQVAKKMEDEIKKGWEDLDKQVKDSAKALVSEGLSKIGEALVTGNMNWEGLGVSAIRSTSAVLKSLSGQFAAQAAYNAVLAVTHLLLGDIPGFIAGAASATVAGVAAIAAGIASGALTAWADQLQDGIDKEREGKKAAKELGESLSGVKSKAQSFADSMKNVGTVITENLIGAMQDGLTGDDFLYSLQEYIRNAVIEAAVYTDALKGQIGAIGARLGSAILGGADEVTLASIRNQLAGLFANANTAAQAAGSLVDSVFGSYAVGSLNVQGDQIARVHNAEMILPKDIADQARMSGLSIAPINANQAYNGARGGIPPLNISVTATGTMVIDGREIGRVAFNYTDQMAKVAYGE